MAKVSICPTVATDRPVPTAVNVLLHSRSPAPPDPEHVCATLSAKDATPDGLAAAHCAPTHGAPGCAVAKGNQNCVLGMTCSTVFADAQLNTTEPREDKCLHTAHTKLCQVSEH